MGHIVCRLMLMGLVIFGSGVAGVRLLAYDAAYFDGLRTALLESPGCENPVCYLGIHPGGTTMRAAHTLLHDHFGSVQAAYLQTDLTNPYMVMWEENGPYFPQGHIEAQSGIALVDFIWLPSDATLGEMWLAFGVPRSIDLYGKFQVIRYGTFSIHTDAACVDFWNEKAGVIITDKLAQTISLTLPDVRRAACDAAHYQ